MGLLSRQRFDPSGLVRYAAAWPWRAWLRLDSCAMGVLFADFTQSLAYLQTRLWLAAALGAAGGPLVYLGAARAWHVVTFPSPSWRALLCLGIGWGLATPALACSSARSPLRRAAPCASAEPAVEPAGSVVGACSADDEPGLAMAAFSHNAGIVDVCGRRTRRQRGTLASLAEGGAWPRVILLGARRTLGSAAGSAFLGTG